MARTITLSDEAVAVIAGMVAPSDVVQADAIFTDVWDEIRDEFPLEHFRRFAELNPGFYGCGPHASRESIA